MDEKRNTPRNPRRRTPFQVNRRLQGQYLSWLLVLTMLLGIGTGILVKDREFSDSENRMLAQFPEITLSSVFDGSFLEELGDYTADQFPGRDAWISLNLKMNQLLGQKEAGGVYLCDDGYLIQVPSEPNWAQAERNLSAVESFAAKYPDLSMVMTVAPNAVTVLSDLFMEAHPGVSIAVQGNGASAGIKAAADGTAQLGMSSRNLKDEEKEGLTPITICMDGIAVIVNLENSVKALTKDQIAAIFKGEITNWQDVGGADEEILIISREAGSGTRSAFEEIVGLIQKDESGNEVTLVDESRALIADSTNAVSTTVAGKVNAIGYISLGSYDAAQVHAIDVDEVPCTQETVLDGSYPIARPFVLVAGPGTEQIANAFLEYVMSAEGQAVVAEKKYIPVK